MLPLAARKDAFELLDQSFWAGIGLVVALLAMAWAIERLRAWSGDDAGLNDGQEELLTHLRRQKAEGDLSDAEYRSIKGRILERTSSPAGRETAGEPESLETAGELPGRESPSTPEGRETKPDEAAPEPASPRDGPSAADD